METIFFLCHCVANVTKLAGLAFVMETIFFVCGRNCHYVANVTKL